MKVRLAVAALLAVAGVGAMAAALAGGPAAGAVDRPWCLARELRPEEQEMLGLHQAWRNLYIPGSDPSKPLQHSAPLQAAALGIADDLAAGALAPADVADELMAERLTACGYPAAIASGGRGIAVGAGMDASHALDAMTAEIWAGGIRVPTWVDGLPMGCVAAAHATAGPGAEAWVVMVSASEAGQCPQALSGQVAPYDGGTPTPTPTFPSLITRTATASPTPGATPTPAPSSYRLFTVVSRD